MSATPIRVLLADGHGERVRSLAKLVTAQSDMRCDGCIASTEDLLDQVDSRCPDVAVIDFSIHGGEPLEALREMTARCSVTRVIVLSSENDDGNIDAAIEAGAWGFLGKNADGGVVLDAIRRVMAGEMVIVEGPDRDSQ